jgi:hypothetical protein
MVVPGYRRVISTPDQMASATAVVDVIVVAVPIAVIGGVHHVCVRYRPKGSECAMDNGFIHLEPVLEVVVVASCSKEWLKADEKSVGLCLLQRPIHCKDSIRLTSWKVEVIVSWQALCVISS